MQKIILLLLSFCPLFSFGQQYPESIYSPNGIAIDGYDPVAYFSENKPIKGKNEFVYKWKETTWLFSSEANLNAFKTNPEKYAPQFGGYCAWGMSEGYKAKIDPVNSWTISDGKLYLNYNKSIKAKWLTNKAALIKTAETNWRKLQ